MNRRGFMKTLAGAAAGAAVATRAGEVDELVEEEIEELVPPEPYIDNTDPYQPVTSATATRTITVSSFDGTATCDQVFLVDEAYVLAE